MKSWLHKVILGLRQYWNCRRRLLLGSRSTARAHLYIPLRGTCAACRRQRPWQPQEQEQRRRVTIFHLSLQIIGRSGGRSSTAAAAYRSACRIVDERTGEVHDFTRKGGVRESFILAPESAPDWMRNRSSLWNGVERAEKRKDAQLCREVEIGLPHELPHEARRRLLAEFIESEFVALGMIADVAMHAPGKDGDRRNEHAHVMLTMRSIDGEGFGNKNRDWNRWNDADHIEKWRARWAQRVNQALEAHAVAFRVDHRSYARQALAAGHDVSLANLPTVHLGPNASSFERRGIATTPGNLNREVKIFNLDLERVRRQEMVEVDHRAAPTPSPILPTPTYDSPTRRDDLRRELRSLLQLDALPTTTESVSAIKRRREELSAGVDTRIRENEELRFRELQLRLATEHFMALRRRHSALQLKGRRLLGQAEKLKRHTRAVGKWSDLHPIKARLIQWGVLRSDRLKTGTGKEREALRADFRRAGTENDQLLRQLLAAQNAQTAAEQALAQVRAEVHSKARSGAAEAFARLDQAEFLLADLQRIEEAQNRARGTATVPIARKPDADRDDATHRRPEP